MSLYDDLGVPADATAAQINAAYRRRAKDEHPDKGGDPAKFAALSRAVAVLRDPERRERYDKTGNADENVPNPEGAAIQELVAAFQQAMTEVPDPARFDIVGGTTAVLLNKINGIKAQRSKVAGDRKIITVSLKRLSHKGERPNILKKYMEDQLAAANAAIAQMDTVEAILKRSIELTKDYSWEVDAAPTQGGFTYVNVQNFSGITPGY